MYGVLRAFFPQSIFKNNNLCAMMCNCEIYDMNNIISTTATNTIFLSAIFSNLDYTIYYYNDMIFCYYLLTYFFLLKNHEFFLIMWFFFLMTTHFSVNKGGRKIGSNELLYFDITLLQENIIKIFLITSIRDLVQVIYRKI